MSRELDAKVLNAVDLNGVAARGMCYKVDQHGRLWLAALDAGDDCGEIRDHQTWFSCYEDKELCVTTKPAAAWSVVEAMRGKGWHALIGTGDDGVSVAFWKKTTPKGGATEVDGAPTMPLAVCRAALAALAALTPGAGGREGG